MSEDYERPLTTQEKIMLELGLHPAKTAPARIEKIFKDEIEHLQTIINTVNKENEELKEHLLSCFSQGTHIRPDFQKDPNHWVYDHMCLSAYESAQDFLIEKGLIKKEECCRK